MTAMIADIYNIGPLTYPKTFQCDNGSEFKGEVTKLLEKHKVNDEIQKLIQHLSKVLTRSSQSSYSKLKMHKG